MPGVRIDRLLASTAVFVLLSAAAGGALAEPKGGTDLDARPGPAAAAPANDAQPAAKPSEPAAAPVKPQAAADQPSETLAQIAAPASSAAPAPSSSQPVTAAASVPPAAASAKPEQASEQSASAVPSPTAASSMAPGADQTAALPATPSPAAAAPAAASKAIESATQVPAPAVQSPAPKAPVESAMQSPAPAATAPAALAAKPPAQASLQSPAPAPTAAPAAKPAATASIQTPPPKSAAPAALQTTTPSRPTTTAAIGGDEVPAATGTPPGPGANDAAAPSASPAIVEADSAVADQLRELANGKFDRLLGGKKDRASIEAFYAARNFAPLWITDGKANARAKAAVAYLGQVDTDGLDPADYPAPNFASVSDPAALAEAELRLTESVVTYARHAQLGRVHWSRVSGDIFYEPKPSNPTEVLANLATAGDVGAALAAYEPQHPAYVALKAKLAELRAGKEEPGKAPIANGPTPKIGMQDDRVPQLRDRLHIRGDGTTYDKDVAEAVKKFQQEHELKVTGTLTPQTVEALNGRPPDRPLDTIIANLERWRWVPHELGKNYVMVNLPDFTLHVFEDGREVWTTKIVDGKPNMPTPIMSAEMKYITVNPTWNVPPSIVAREYMPVLQQDPTALERIGLTVSSNPDGTVHISQPPGERNALGRLRFNFPNKFLVYQHDTPQKQLFAFEKRAFSHGCMRVQDPVKYAEVLLSIVRPKDGYTQDRIRKMFGTAEVDIQFPNFLPVHLTYQTAFVDEDGRLQFREDVYGRDKVLIAILKGDERRVAEIPVEHRENTVRRELLSMPDQGFGRFGGDNFFTRLFGGGPAVQPQAAPPPGQRKRAAQRPTEIR